MLQVSEPCGPEGLSSMYVGPYRKKIPHSVSNPNQVPIVENHVLSVLEDQGFDLDVKRDNKSVASKSDLFDALSRYQGDEINAHWSTLSKAISSAFHAFAGDGSLTPLLSEDQLYSALKLDKSSGAPEFKSKSDAFQVDFRRARRVISGKRPAQPCVAYHRVQHGEAGPKTRLVWGFPLSMTIVEAAFARPLIDKFLQIRTPMAFGLHKMDLSARAQVIENSNIRVGLDVSKFDASVKPRLIRVAFDILKTWFTNDSDMERHWNVIQEYFVHTPIIMPDRNIYKKHQGVPSGSYFTQMVDSIVNYIMVQYIFLRVRGQLVNQKYVMVLGDDSLVGISDPINMNAVVRAASEIGFKINSHKSEISRFGQSMAFLGHHWEFGLPSRSVDELVKRAVFPERISGIDDADTRRLTRVVSLSGDAHEGMKLFRAYGVPIKALLATSLNVRPDRVQTGWLDLLASQGGKERISGARDYLTLSLYR